MEEPDSVKEWRQSYAAFLDFIPKCCFTCQNHSKTGVCSHHQAEPPLEFKNTIDGCEAWVSEMEPF